MMELRPFSERDFDEYALWYADPQLNDALGPMDEEWREAVIDQQPPTHFSVLDSDSLVAVVGVCYPSSVEPTYVITDLAVDPRRRGQGIGAKVVSIVIGKFALKEKEAWVAFVDTKNTTAQKFFQAVGWNAVSDPDVHGMIRFELGTREKLDRRASRNRDE